MKLKCHFNRLSLRFSKISGKPTFLSIAVFIMGLGQPSNVIANEPTERPVMVRFYNPSEPCFFYHFEFTDSASTAAIREKFDALSTQQISPNDTLSASLRCKQTPRENISMSLFGVGEQHPPESSKATIVNFCGEILLYTKIEGDVYLIDEGKTLEKLIIQLGLELKLQSTGSDACDNRPFSEIAESYGYIQDPAPSWSLTFTTNFDETDCRILSVSELDLMISADITPFFAAAGECGLLKGSIGSIVTPSELVPVQGVLENKAVTYVSVNNLDVLAGTSENGVYISHDQANSWMDLSKGLPTQNDDTLYDYVVQIESLGDNIFALTAQNGLYRFAVADSAWVTLFADKKMAPYSSMTIENDSIFVSSLNGQIAFSPDWGQSWTILPVIGIQKAEPLQAHTEISKIVYNKGALYAVVPTDCLCNNPSLTDGHVFKSTDLGGTWEPFISPVLNAPRLYFDSEDEQIFFGVDNIPSARASKWLAGIYYSQDEGRHWVSLRKGLVDLPTQMFQSPSRLYAATSSGEIFTIHRHDLNQIKTVSNVQKAGKFRTNFTPRTLIKGNEVFFLFQKPLHSKTEVSVMNARGCSIPVEYQMDRNSGVISIHLPFSPKGIYYAEFRIGAERYTALFGMESVNY